VTDNWPMTWGEFKRAVDALGVFEDEELWFIDWDGGKPELYDGSDLEKRKSMGVAIT
jgi:hypothetical protein